MRHVNQSEMTSFIRCPRKWNWGFIQGLESPNYSSPLSTGSAVHKALQAHYKGSDPFIELTDFWLPIVETTTEDDPWYEQVRKDMNLSQIMMEGYLEWLDETSADAYLTPVLNEETVEWEILPGVTLYGTLDLVLQDGDGQYWLIDHKTTDAFGRLANRRLQLNFQLLTYAVLCRQRLGVQPAGAYLNMLRKVQRTGNAKPPFYHREPVHFNQFMLDSHETHMRAIIQKMLEAEERIAAGDNTVAYPVVGDDCDWRCSFKNVCVMADDGSDIEGALNDLYVKRT